MNGNHPLQPEELTLVDLAKILVRKRYWVIGVFILVWACTITFGLLRKLVVTEPEKSQYVITILLGYGTPIAMLETPDAVRDRISRVYWPAVVDEFKKQNKPVKEITFESELPKTTSTNLIRFVMASDSVSPNAVQAFHRRIAELAFERHQRLLETFKSVVERAANARVSTAIYESFASEIATVADAVFRRLSSPHWHLRESHARHFARLALRYRRSIFVHFVEIVRRSMDSAASHEVIGEPSPLWFALTEKV